MTAMSEEASSGSGRSAESLHVDVSSLQHYKNRVGPELRHMRQAQGRNRCHCNSHNALPLDNSCCHIVSHKVDISSTCGSVIYTLLVYREYYTLDHLRRLKQFEAQSPYNEAKCSDYCKDYHVQPCRACTTCHFCRYATTHSYDASCSLTLACASALTVLCMYNISQYAARLINLGVHTHICPRGVCQLCVHQR